MNSTTTPTTALMFWTEQRDGYLHLYGAFCYDGGSSQPAWGSYREVRKDGLLFEGLRIVSQGNDAAFDGTTTDRKLYGWGVEYREVFSLDLREAEQHLKTLRVLDRKLAKIRETQGYPKSLGQFVGQVAQAVKAGTFYFRQDRCTPYVYSVRRSIADAISHIDNIEHQWRRAGQEGVA